MCVAYRRMHNGFLAISSASSPIIHRKRNCEKLKSTSSCSQNCTGVYSCNCRGRQSAKPELNASQYIGYSHLRVRFPVLVFWGTWPCTALCTLHNLNPYKKSQSIWKTSIYMKNFNPSEKWQSIWKSSIHMSKTRIKCIAIKYSPWKVRFLSKVSASTFGKLASTFGKLTLHCIHCIHTV